MTWNEESNRIINTYEFDDFKEAIVFVNKVAELAEEQNHHPDIKIFDYNNVEITLTTHDVGKVTKKDHKLAEKIDALD